MQRYALYLYRALVGVNPDLMWVVFHSLGGTKKHLFQFSCSVSSLPPEKKVDVFRKKHNRAEAVLRKLVNDVARENKFAIKASSHVTRHVRFYE